MMFPVMVDLGGPMARLDLDCNHNPHCELVLTLLWPDWEEGQCMMQVISGRAAIESLLAACVRGLEQAEAHDCGSKEGAQGG